MARNPFRDDWADFERRQRELNEERQRELEQLKIQQQIKIKKMVKTILAAVLGIVLVSFLFSACERIDAGHVGVKVNLYGSQKGVDGITEVTGMVFFNPFTTKIYEFPTFVQHKEYTGEESFSINSKDGSEFKVSPILNYQVLSDKVPFIFGKYRRSLEQIEVGFLKTAVYDAFRIATNGYTADSLISNRENFEHRVRTILEKTLNSEGFAIQQFTSNLVYPETFVQAINAKNNAVQQALKAENDVRTAEANAKIKVATAQGDADAMITRAKAEAESNRLKQQTLTNLLLQQQWIEKWDGKLPVYGQAPMLYKPVQ
jgi:regulator of protease activity HflC (stomatin/prohibitin superfamily)